MINIEAELKNYESKKIAVLLGGLSSEREISIRSGTNVFNIIKRLGLNCIKIDVDKNISQRLNDERIDLAVIMLHGKYGEDGCIQGLLEIMGIPYTGPGVLPSSICMNKKITKKILASRGIPVSPFIDCTSKEIYEILRLVKESFGFPAVIKPNCEGSSIGIVKVKDENELEMALKNYEYDDFFIEKYIEGKEITVGGIMTKDEFIDLPFLGLVPQNEFYDFDAKYTKGKTLMEIPAKVSKNTEENIKEYIKIAFEELKLYGVARLDIIIDRQDNPYFLEVNTIPGMTETSDIPAMSRAKGLSDEELVLLILKSAYK